MHASELFASVPQSLVLFALVVVAIGSAFDSSEIRLLEDQNGGKRQATYWSYFSNGPDGAVKRSQQYAATSPIIRFGKRSSALGFNGGMARQARTQQHMMDPIIRFGKRTPSTAPLIRFGKRHPNNPSAPLIRFGKRSISSLASSAPHIRFGKRDAEPDLTSSEEIMGFYEPSAADYLYSRFNRNRRPNPVDFEDTMLRFG